MDGPQHTPLSENEKQFAPLEQHWYCAPLDSGAGLHWVVPSVHLSVLVPPDEDPPEEEEEDEVGGLTPPDEDVLVLPDDEDELEDEDDELEDPLLDVDGVRDPHKLELEGTPERSPGDGALEQGSLTQT